MTLQQTACSVLLVSSSEKMSASITALLPASDYFPVHKVKTAVAAERMLTERTYDFVIVNSPLSDGPGIDFAIDASLNSNAIVLLMVSGELNEEIFFKVSPHGVFTIARPITRQTFELALRWLSVVRMRSRKTQAKTLSLEEKMQEIRLINRAKLLLISEENMDESTAHRYIEKQAMDRCISKREVAEEIVRTYA